MVAGQYLKYRLLITYLRQPSPPLILYITPLRRRNESHTPWYLRVTHASISKNNTPLIESWRQYIRRIPFIHHTYLRFHIAISCRFCQSDASWFTTLIITTRFDMLRATATHLRFVKKNNDITEAYSSDEPKMPPMVTKNTTNEQNENGNITKSPENGWGVFGAIIEFNVRLARHDAINQSVITARNNTVYQNISQYAYHCIPIVVFVITCWPASP